MAACGSSVTQHPPLRTRTMPGRFPFGARRQAKGSESSRKSSNEANGMNNRPGGDVR